MLDVETQIFGVRGAHQELKLLDSAIRKELRKEAKKIVRPLIEDAKNRYPKTQKKNSPIRGVNYAWAEIKGEGFPYIQARAKRGVRFSVDGTRKNRTVFRVRQVDAAASVLEVIGRSNGLGRAVSGRFGTRDRFMWRAAVRTGPAVRRELQATIMALVYGINRKNDRDAMKQGRM